MIRYFITIAIISCQCFNLGAQFLDDFSDGDLTASPMWNGNLEDFIINEDEVLQLNASEEGQSNLFTPVSFSDSIQWDFEVRLDFDPSANNRLRIYVAADRIELAPTSGYFVEIGQNGGDDALDFYYFEGENSILLASGETGALSTQPAYLACKIVRFPNGEWNISTAYEIDKPLREELFFIHNEYDFSGEQFFNIECNYTSSRRDRFYFDNIGVRPYQEDNSGPEILSVKLVTSNTIEIQTDEILSADVPLNSELFTISPYNGSIASADLFNEDTAVRLHLSDDFMSGTVYNITIDGLKDVNGNPNVSQTYELRIEELPITGDLIVNEILFNPETGGSDYVEFINVSSKFIVLNDLELVNLDKDEGVRLITNQVLDPGGYVCFSEDIAYLKERYQTPDTARLIESDLPSFNNDKGNVTLLSSGSKEVIDSFTYFEELHYQELKDLNGVSLERVSPTEKTWFSASSATLFGTPGYQNSTFIRPEFEGVDLLEFENRTFSPNQDGMDDQLVIRYHLPDIGYQVDIFVYDQYGRRIEQLANNELLPNQGLILWDGLKASGEQAEIGIYFIILEAFNIDGEVVSEKKSVILADFLK